MIRSFSVQNFLSIKDRQELSFVAKQTDSILVSKMPNGEYLYKLGVLYGSNASGKSNMLLAMETIFSLLLKPRQANTEKINNYYPFALTKDEPTLLSISFYANAIRYDYELFYNADNILFENLVYYPNGSKSLFYQRQFASNDLQPDIKFGGSLHLQPQTQNSIREYTLNNHTVLSVCAKNSFKEDFSAFKSLYNALYNNYHEVDGDIEMNIDEILASSFNDDSKYPFFCKMLQKADLNIIDYEIVTKNINDKTVSFHNGSKIGNFSIPSEFQSTGTRKYIRILDMLYTMLKGEHTYFLDELGEDLHCDLLLFYLNVFLYNSNHSQLIITSQETLLLSQEIINDNRGAIWFVDKNRDTASSEYNRGDSFGLHKNLSFYNSYHIGRLGAKPELGSFFVDIN